MNKKILVPVIAVFLLLCTCFIFFYISQVVVCSNAIANSKAYLKHFTLSNGRFVYSINLPNNEIVSRYSIIRHAGTIYAMQLLEDSLHDSSLQDTKIHAIKYFTDNYVQKIAPDKYAILNKKAKKQNTIVKLGALGVGLCALAQNTNDIVMLQGLGNSILYMQDNNGNFISQYDYVTGQKSNAFLPLYYPGEASLGLLYLYDIDKQEKWLQGAKLGLLYLAKSRESIPDCRLPFDHWSIIAIKKLLKTPHNTLTTEDKTTLQNYAERMVNLAMIRQEVSKSKLEGAFGKNNLCDIGIYVEGLASAYYCTENLSLKLKILRTLYRANKLIMKNQIKKGKYRGGITKEANCPYSSAKNACTIRIDYIQHTMSGFILYRDILF